MDVKTAHADADIWRGYMSSTSLTSHIYQVTIIALPIPYHFVSSSDVDGHWQPMANILIVMPAMAVFVGIVSRNWALSLPVCYVLFRSVNL